ncbi:MAG TPA: hypothetical protein VFY26_01850 [Anaerolineales bacterium]|nr:hypothetical protein [Anaerolineales bacterium]
MLNLINLLLGAALLLAGRKLFWLFIGIVGFITGVQLAARFWDGPEWTAIVIGIIVGLLFALLAVFIEALAIGIAGFLVGGYVLTTFTNMLGFTDGLLFWLFFAIGGMIGLLLVMFLFDWALIVLSSLAGASLVVQALFAEGGPGSLVFIGLFLLGLIIQGMILLREETPPVRRYRRIRRVRRAHHVHDETVHHHEE